MAKFVQLDGIDIGDIKIYSLSTCGWCRKTKELFRDNGIKFAFVDVDTLNGDDREKAKDEVMAFNPRLSFPTTIINGGEEVVAGFDETRLRALITNQG
ncbi:MAG: glutaredoxin family protein [Clostridia bacterium]